MSNSQVGTVYQQIINDVLEASRVDFEEGGVDESVLEELKTGWQRKLSQQQLAQFPWDPKPDPPAPAAAPQPVSAPEPTPQVSTNGTSHHQQYAPQQQGLHTTMAGQPSNDHMVKPEPGVKTEPGLEGTPMMAQAHNPGVVQERVTQQLQSMYGDRAAASINKLREQPVNGTQSGNQQRPAQPMPQGYPGQYQGHPQQQQYRQNMPVNAAGQQRPPIPNGQRPQPSQTDGTADDESHVGVLMRRGPAGNEVEMGRVEIDSLLHAQIAAKAKAMEGGGLMLPLSRRDKSKTVSGHRTPAAGASSQFDGPADDSVKDEEEDEDAINSDLDDPDDNIEDDDEDEDGGQIMLCMYDKVQRVKNKWKCVLKDGVLTVNGKDYVFHKATGEYEW